MIIVSPFSRGGYVCSQTFDLTGNDQFFVLTERNAMLGREAFGAFGYKVKVRTFAQNLACCANRIAQVLDATHSSGAQGCPIHDQGIKLHSAFAIEKCAVSGIEGFVVLHYDDSLLDCIKGAASLA